VDTKAALHTSPAISCDTTVYFVSAEEEFWAVAPDGSVR